MIEYIQGDVIKAFEEVDNVVLCHIDNCSSLYKKGFAKTLYNKYPKANTNSIMSNYFGDAIKTYMGDSKCIVNLYSQYYPGNSSDKLGKYDGFELYDNYNNRIKALEHSLYETSKIVDEGDLIIMPLIASGLGKCLSKEYSSDLDYFKKYIAPIVEEYLKDYNVKVYYL
jgi:hypothetical protein